MSCCFSAGRKEQCPRTCVTSTSSRYTKTRMTTATVTMQLPWNIHPQYHWEGLCPCGVEQVGDVSGKGVPRGSVRFRAGKSTIDNNLFTKAAAGKVSWVEETAIYCLYRPDQGLWPNQQKGSIHSPAKDRMPFQAKLLSMITSFHEDMQGTVQYDGSASGPFPIKNGVKQGCVVAPTLFGIFFFSLVLLEDSSDKIAVYLTPKKDAVRKRCIFSLLLTTCLLCWTYLLDCRLWDAHMTLQGTYTFSL